MKTIGVLVLAATLLASGIGCKKKVALGTYAGTYSVTIEDGKTQTAAVKEKDTEVSVSGSGEKLTMKIFDCALEGTSAGENKVRFEVQECAVQAPGIPAGKLKLGGEATIDTAGGLLTIDVKGPGAGTASVALQFTGMLKQ